MVLTIGRRLGYRACLSFRIFVLLYSFRVEAIRAMTVNVLPLFGVSPESLSLELAQNYNPMASARSPPRKIGGLSSCHSPVTLLKYLSISLPNFVFGRGKIPSLPLLVTFHSPDILKTLVKCPTLFTSQHKGQCLFLISIKGVNWSELVTMTDRCCYEHAHS